MLSIFTKGGDTGDALNIASKPNTNGNIQGFPCSLLACFCASAVALISAETTTRAFGRLELSGITDLAGLKAVKPGPKSTEITEVLAEVAEVSVGSVKQAFSN